MKVAIYIVIYRILNYYSKVTTGPVADIVYLPEWPAIEGIHYLHLALRPYQVHSAHTHA